ncbi:MAG: LacI family DNA-binding transcriptional regulator, partial [Beijerinckiaceae bacterium]
QAVRATGYTPNAAARNLRARKAMMVLIVVPDIANPFFAEILRGVDAALSAAGYGLIIGNLDNSAEKEARYMQLALSGQVDGILLLCGHVLKAGGRTLDEAQLPIVAACEVIPGAPFAQVEINNADAAADAVRHLAGLGHRRIAYLSGPSGNILDQARRRGYRRALKLANLPFDASLVMAGNFTFQSGVEAALGILAMPPGLRPTALFAANDEMAIGALKTLHARGVAIPRDFSIVGFDAIEYADYCEPILTTVRQPRWDIGSKAGEKLVAAMTGPSSDATLVTLQADLLVRESSGPAPDRAPESVKRRRQ